MPIRDVNPTTRVAIVTIGLIVANLVVFFVWQPEEFIGLGTGDGSVEAVQSDFLDEYAMVPCEVTHFAPLSDALETECGGGTGSAFGDTPYHPDKVVAASVVVSMFLHAGLIHLFGNMWYRWIFGNNVEDRFGPAKYPRSTSAEAWSPRWPRWPPTQIRWCPWSGPRGRSPR